MKRWKLILLSVVGTAVLGLYVASQSGWLLGAARQSLEDGLHQATGRRVHVGSVTGGFSGWVWLNDLSLGPAPDGRLPDVSFTARAVGLKLNWVRLVLHRQASLQDLRGVRVKDADAYVLLPRVEAASNSPAAQAQDPLAGLRLGLRNAPLPPVRVQLQRGRIWAARPAQPLALWLDQAELDAAPVQGRLALDGSGVVLGGAQIQLSAESDAELKQAQAQLKFKQLSLGLIPLPQGLSLSAGSLEGQVQVNAQPGLGGVWPGLRVEGSGRLEGGALRWRDRPAVEQAQARWALKDGRLQVSTAQAMAAQGRWKGDADLDLNTGTLKAKASSPALALPALAQLAGAPAGLSLTGDVAADFEAAGPLSATALSLELHSQEALWRGQALSSLDLRWDQSGAGRQSLDGRLAWAEGQAHVEAAIEGPGSHHGSVDVSGLQADWFEPWAGVTLTGRVKAHARWQGSPQGLTWEAEAGTEELGLGGLSLLHASVQGWGDSKAVHARVEGDALGWKGVNAEMDARLGADKAWVLKGAKAFVGDRLLAQVEGQGQADANGLWQGDWRVKAGPWPAADLPFTRELTGLSGTVQAQGSLRAVAGRWDWQGQIDGPSLSRGGQSAALHAKAAGAAGSLSLTAINLRKGELQGELYWLGGKRLSADWHLEQADLGALGSLAGVQGLSLSGTVNGQLQMTQEGSARTGKAALSFKALRVADLIAAKGELSGSLDGQHWHLQRWSAEQEGAGRWTAQGSLDLGGREGWSGKSEWKDWAWGQGVWSGQGSLSGGKGSEAQLVVNELRLGGSVQPDLKVAVFFTDQEPEAWRMDWGAGLQAQGQRVNKGWNLQVALKDEDPSLLLGALKGRPLSTGLHLSGSLKWRGLGLDDQSAALNLEGLSKLPKGTGTVSGHWKRGSAKEAWQGRWDWAGVDLEPLLRGMDKAGWGLGVDLRGESSGRVEAGAHGVSFTSSLSSVRLEGAALGPGSLAGTWDQGVLRLDSLALGASGPRLSVKKARFSSAKEAWTAEADLEMQDLPYNLFVLGGVGRVKASGKGHEGKVASDWGWLQVGTRRFDSLALDTTWKDGAWTVAPRKGKAFKAMGRAENGDFVISSLDSREGKGSASLKGQVLHDGSLSFDGQATGFPAGELTSLLGWPQEWRGAAYGSLTVRGNTTTAHTVVSAKIENGSVQGLAFDLAQATVHIEDGWVKLAPLGPIKVSRRQAYVMEVDGRIPLDDLDGKPFGPLDVHARLVEGGLGFLASLPGIKSAEGPLDMHLDFVGDRNDPTVNGSLKVTGGSLSPAWVLPPLEKMDLFVQIDEGQVQLQQAQARVVGGGPLLRLEQTEKGRPAFVLERWLPERFNLRLRASASGLPVRSTAALRFLDGTLHPDLALVGGWMDPAVTGALTLDRGDLEKAIVTWPAQFNPPLPKDEAEPGFLDRVEWDLVMNARKDVMLRSDVAQIFVDTGEGGLRLRGAVPHRSLEGRLHAIKGSVDYLLTSFDLATDKPSWVEFLGEDAPQLELQGSKRVHDALLSGQTVRHDVDVRLHAFGPLGQVQMVLDSDDKTLTQDQLASLAGFGVDSSDQRNQGGFARLLGKAPAAVLTRYARRSGLVDEVGVRLPGLEDAMAGGSQNVSSAAQIGSASDISSSSKPLVELSAGKWVSEKLFVGLNGLLTEKRDSKGSTVDPALGGKVEYQLKNDARLSAQQNVDTGGQSEQRVMLERASSFDNYNPRQRRWGQATPVPTPYPTRVPTETPVPVSGTGKAADDLDSPKSPLK